MQFQAVARDVNSLPECVQKARTALVLRTEIANDDVLTKKVQALVDSDTDEMLKECYGRIVDLSKEVEALSPGDYETRHLQCYMAAKAVCNDSY